MSSRVWDYVAIAGIVVALVFLIFFVRPLLGWEWSGTLLSVALVFLLAVAIPLFVRGLKTIMSFARQVTSRDGDGPSNSDRRGSKRVTLLGLSLVAVLSIIGLAGVLAALPLLPFHHGPSNPPTVVTAVAVKTTPQPKTPQDLYLDLLKKTLTRAQVAGRYERYTIRPNPVNRLTLTVVEPMLHAEGYDLVGLRASDPDAYMNDGGENSARLDDGETMVGLLQLDNMQACVEDVLRRNVPGDLIEAGAWRGGLTILMRGVLKAYGDTDRKVFVADSFEGLPPVDAAKDATHYYQGQMAVSLDEVKENFARYGLLDDQVVFLKGFFNQTLPNAPIQKLAIFRADGDLYESTMDALNNLYPKLSVGGYAIFDDYVEEPAVKEAIDDYRAAHNITEPIRRIDNAAVYWQREK
jgi:O-methyltransferase